MISKLNIQRVKILASKGNDNKSISQKIGITEKAVRMVVEPKMITLIGKAKRPVKILKTKVTKRPKSKHLLVREYIESTDTVYREDMNKIGVAHITTSLACYAKNHNVKFVKLNEFSWAIER